MPFKTLAYGIFLHAQVSFVASLHFLFLYDTYYIYIYKYIMYMYVHKLLLLVVSPCHPTTPFKAT